MEARSSGWAVKCPLVLLLIIVVNGAGTGLALDVLGIQPTQRDWRVHMA